MPRKKHDEFKAGIFVIICLAAAIGVILWLGVAQVFAPKGNKIAFFIPESTGDSGLGTGSQILYAGLQIGKINEIRYDEKRKGALFIGSTYRKIYSNGEAVITSPLIGNANVAILKTGTPDKPLADIKYPITATGGLMEAMREMENAIKNVGAIVATLKKEFDEKDKKSIISLIKNFLATLNQAVTKVDKVADIVNSMAIDAKPKISGTLSSIQETAKNLEKYSGKDFAEIITNVRKASVEVLTIAKNISTISEETKQIIVVNHGSIDEIIDNMVQVSGNLKATATEVRRNPWRLLYDPTDKDIAQADVYDAARAFSNGATELDQSISRLIALKKAFPKGIPSDNKQLKEINEQLKESFRKFKKVENKLWDMAEKQQ